MARREEKINLVRKEEKINLVRKEEKINLVRKEEKINLVRKEEKINLVRKEEKMTFHTANSFSVLKVSQHRQYNNRKGIQTRLHDGDREKHVNLNTTSGAGCRT